MIDKQTDCGPAFPISISCADGSLFTQFGMSLRDYLAGQALAGAASIQLTEEEMAGLGTADDARAALAKHAYALADAMLAERAKRNGP